MLQANVTTTDSSVTGPHGPIPVRWYSPPRQSLVVNPVPVVWVHGGGFVRGSLDLRETHEVASALAANGFRVVTVDYRLASKTGLLPQRLRRAGQPTNHYPVPVDDVVAVIRTVQQDAPAGVIVGGASAGACLVAGAVLRIAADGGDALRGVFFAYGFFHAALPEVAPELRRRLRGRRRYTHTPSLLNLMHRNYAGTTAALAEPFAFPGGHQLTSFPPALLLDADRDSMRASGSAFARELDAASVPVDYHVVAETSHAFLNRPEEPGFAEGIRLISAWATRI